MRLVGMMPVRNEDWVIGLSLRVALLYCDAVVVLNHASTDRTAEILAEIAREDSRLTILEEPNESWDEMAHRQRMLVEARRLGATHLAIVDADEVLSGNVLPYIRKHVMDARADRMVHLPIYNARGMHDRYHASGIWGNRIVSFAFPDNLKAGWGGDQFHHREPFGVKWTGYQPVSQGNGGVIHLWGVTERRLIAKHARYKIIERLRWPQKSIADIDQTYNLAIREPASLAFGAWSFREMPISWWAPYQTLMKHLDLERTPWQEAETRRLVGEHGRHHFAGLNLFGVA